MKLSKIEIIRDVKINRTEVRFEPGRRSGHDRCTSAGLRRGKGYKGI